MEYFVYNFSNKFKKGLYPELTPIVSKDSVTYYSEKISINSVLLENEALNILTECMVPSEIMDIVSHIISEKANMRENTLAIKVSVCSIVSQFSLCGKNRAMFLAMKKNTEL